MSGRVGGLECVENSSNVASLGLQQAGQPPTVVGESHVHHGLEGNLDLGIGMEGDWSLEFLLFRFNLLSML
jgi:hypothetical protein